MGQQDGHEITELLDAWSHGDSSALDRLVPLVTTQLRGLARSYMGRESAGHTLEPTALVNELYLRLVGRRKVSWQNRAHFFAFAATTMRRILVDHARGKNTEKRGRGIQKLSLDEALGHAEPVDLLALDEALKELEERHERQARIVELRCFTGLTAQETAEVLDVSRSTVQREWTSARAWLYAELGMARRGGEPKAPLGDDDA